jgi:hypothetical protein
MFLLLLVFTCCGNSKLDLKTVRNNDLTVSWYRESYVSSTKVFVSAETSNTEEIILDCQDGVITAVSIVQDTIKIKLYGGKKDIYAQLPSVDKFHVKIDSSVTYQEWNRYYHPELYNKSSK